VGNLDTFGSKFGPRVAQLVTQSLLSTKVALAPYVVKTAVHAANTFTDQIGAEFKAYSSGAVDLLLESGELPEWLHKHFNFMRNGHGQWQALAANTAIGSTIGTGLMGLLNNELNPAVTAIVAANPHIQLSPQEAAHLVASGEWSDGRGDLEARRSGIDSQRFRSLVNAAQSYPPVDMLLSMLNRGSANEAEVRNVLQRQSISGTWQNRIIGMRHVPLSPELLAEMTDRSIVSVQEATNIAADSGVSAKDFARMTEAVGQPPATELLLAAFRRGIINKARLTRGITQSHLRTEWADIFEKLQFDPLTADQAVHAAAQNLLPIPKAREYARQAGLDAPEFEVLLEAAGQPPSYSDMIEFVRRGLMTKAQMEQGIREGPLKNKYIPLIMAGLTRIPPMETVRAMYNRGSIDRATAARMFAQLGFEASLIQGMLDEVDEAKTESHRNLAESTVRDLYEEGAITRAQASEFMSSLGYNDDQVDFVLSMHDVRRSRKFRESAITRVRTRFVGHKIDINEASMALDQLLIPPKQRDDLLEIWEIEATTTTPTLSASQVIRAMKKDLVTQDEALDRIIAMGYSERDAAILVQSA